MAGNESKVGDGDHFDGRPTVSKLVRSFGRDAHDPLLEELRHHHSPQADPLATAAGRPDIHPDSLREFMVR